MIEEERSAVDEGHEIETSARCLEGPMHTGSAKLTERPMRSAAMRLLGLPHDVLMLVFRNLERKDSRVLMPACKQLYYIFATPAWQRSAPLSRMVFGRWCIDPAVNVWVSDSSFRFADTEAGCARIEVLLGDALAVLGVSREAGTSAPAAGVRPTPPRRSLPERRSRGKMLSSSEISRGSPALSSMMAGSAAALRCRVLSCH